MDNVPCVAVDVAWKIVKKDHSYDLADLQLKRLAKNLESIRKAKNSMCKFSSLLVSILFYVQIPSLLLEM